MLWWYCARTTMTAVVRIGEVRFGARGGRADVARLRGGYVAAPLQHCNTAARQHGNRSDGITAIREHTVIQPHDDAVAWWCGYAHNFYWSSG